MRGKLAAAMSGCFSVKIRSWTWVSVRWYVHLLPSLGDSVTLLFFDQLIGFCEGQNRSGPGSEACRCSFQLSKYLRGQTDSCTSFWNGSRANVLFESTFTGGQLCVMKTHLLDKSCSQVPKSILANCLETCGIFQALGASNNLSELVEKLGRADNEDAGFFVVIFPPILSLWDVNCKHLHGDSRKYFVVTLCSPYWFWQSQFKENETQVLLVCLIHGWCKCHNTVKLA